jgi:hypothetical protein
MAERLAVWEGSRQRTVAPVRAQAAVGVGADGLIMSQ